MKKVETKNVKVQTDKQTAVFPVSKVVEIDTGIKTFATFDKLDDGTFRLTFTKGLFKVIDE